MWVALSLLLIASPGELCADLLAAEAKAPPQIALGEVSLASCRAQSEVASAELLAATEACLSKRCPAAGEDRTTAAVRPDGALGSEGPSGSGRYWGVVFLQRAGGKTVGACLSAETHAFRFVSSGAQVPLPWVVDLDGDRRDEIVVWSSVRGRVEALAPIVYRVTPAALVRDADATRQMRARVAGWYERQAASTRAADEDALTEVAHAMATCGAKREEPTPTPGSPQTR